MPQPVVHVISDCIIAFDLTLSKYTTLNPAILELTGSGPGEISTEANFWYRAVHPEDLADVEKMYGNLELGQAAEITYRIKPAHQNSFRYVTEKRSVYTDVINGHTIVLSILKDYVPAALIIESCGGGNAHKNEQVLLSLLRSQTNFLIRLSKTGHYTFVNNAFCNAIAHQPETLIGAHFSINTQAEDLDSFEEAFVGCMNNPGKVVPLIKNKITKGKRTLTVEWEFMAVVDESGEVTGIQGIGQNVSQRLKVKRLVKETSEKLETFIENISDSFFILDKQWRFIRTNPSFEQLFNHTGSGLTGKNIFDVFPTLNTTGLPAALDKAVATGKSVQFTEYFPLTSIWARTTIYPSADGFTVFIKDITEQKVAEGELFRTQQKLESLINNSDDLIWSIDNEMRYMYTNAVYKEAIAAETGIMPTEGQPLVIFGTDEVRSLWHSFYQRALSGERFDIAYEHYNSITFNADYYEIGFNPIYNAYNQVEGMGCFARNVTEHKKYENEIIRQNERLRQIASISSHELRRPVASLLGLINIIDFDDFGNPDNKETIGHLLTVGKEIDEVIRLIVDNTFTG